MKKKNMPKVQQNKSFLSLGKSALLGEIKDSVGQVIYEKNPSIPAPPPTQLITPSNTPTPSITPSVTPTIPLVSEIGRAHV